MSLSPSWSESNTSKVGGYASSTSELVQLLKGFVSGSFVKYSNKRHTQGCGVYSRAAFINILALRCGVYLRAAFIRGRRLFEEIRYLSSYVTGVRLCILLGSAQSKSSWSDKWIKMVIELGNEMWKVSYWSKWHGIREVMGLIHVGDSHFFIVPHLSCWSIHLSHFITEFKIHLLYQYSQ